MLDPKQANIYSADVNVVIGDRERAVLSAYIQQEGFDILQTLMEDIVRKQNRRILNVDPAHPDYDKIVGNLSRTANAVGGFYVDLMTRLGEEFNLHVYNARKLGTVENPENPNIEDFN